MDNFRSENDTMHKIKADHYFIDKREILAGLFNSKEQANNAVQALKSTGFLDDQVKLHYMDPVSKDGINLSLTGMGFPLEEASYFEPEYRNGKILVVIKPEDRTEDAYEILIRSGADIGTSVHNTSVKKEIESMKRRIDVQHQNFTEREMIGGMFTARENARMAIEELKKLGFADEQIRMYYFDSPSEKEHLELIGMGFPTIEARYFERGYGRGDTLLTIRAGNKLQEAMEVIMRNNGDIGSSAYEQNENDHNLHSLNNYELGMD